MKTKSLALFSFINRFIRSLLFSIIFVVTAFLHSALCVILAPLPLRFRHPFTCLWLRGMVKLAQVLCNINYQVEGWNNVKKIKNGIILSKHQSAWETLFLQPSFHLSTVIVKRELLWIPFFGWAFALIAPIAINRSNPRSAMQQIISKGKQYLDAGRWVIVYPEGTRVASGHVGKYRLGGARLAVETGYPIIPVAHNAGRCWPRRQFMKIPGMIKVVFGPPIYPQGKTAEEVLQLAKDWIESTMQKIDI